MIDDRRFDRVELKVDKLNDDVIEIKSNIKNMSDRLDLHMEKVEAHVAGDNKIIYEIQPLLQQMPTIAKIIQEYHLEKLQSEQKLENMKRTSLAVGLVVAVVTVGNILYSIFK